MKKTIVVVCVLLFLVLLVPYPAKAKDGGSVHYNAILYEVYDVHSLYSDPDPDNGPKYVEGVIIEIFGVQVYNNTHPHIDFFGDNPDLEYRTSGIRILKPNIPI